MNQYKRLTIPSITKEAGLHKNGLTSQRTEEDQITLELPVTSFENPRIHQSVPHRIIEDEITLDLPAMPYENQWAHQKSQDILDSFLSGGIPFTPRLPETSGHRITAFLTIPFTPRPTGSNGHSNGHNGYTNGHNGSTNTAFEAAPVPYVPDPQIDAIISAVLAKKTIRAMGESPVVSGPQSKRKTASKWAFFLELPYLLVYMIGALAIAGLYLIIPLLNLLNVAIPGNLNTLLIALGIIIPCELLVCFILARTIPRGKAKKGSLIAES